MIIVNKLIPKEDKLKHAYLWTLAFLVSAIVLVLILDNNLAINISLGLTIFTAAYKELIIDGLQGKGRVEFLDFIYSILFPLEFTVLYYLTIFT